MNARESEAARLEGKALDVSFKAAAISTALLCNQKDRHRPFIAQFLILLGAIR